MEKTPVVKKTKFGYNVLSKPNFNTKNKHFEKSHNAEKFQRRGPLGFFNIQFVAKHRKKDTLETIKNFRKIAHSAENNRKGDPLVSSGFVCCLKWNK